MGVFLPPTLPRLFEKGRLYPGRTHLFARSESKVKQQREIILALERRHTYNKGHNNREKSRLRQLSPGMRVHKVQKLSERYVL